jgi:hypothetical protein
LLHQLQLSPTQIHGVASAFGSSFMGGFHLALAFGGAVLLAGAFVANRFIPGRETVTHEPAPEHGAPVPAEI